MNGTVHMKGTPVGSILRVCSDQFGFLFKTGRVSTVPAQAESVVVLETGGEH